MPRKTDYNTIIVIEYIYQLAVGVSYIIEYNIKRAHLHTICRMNSKSILVSSSSDLFLWYLIII